MPADQERFMDNDALNISLGQGGSTFINTTGAKTLTDERWACIIPYEATVFTLLTNEAGVDGDTRGAYSHPAGVPIYGLFSAITLASGAVEAYKAQNWKRAGGG